jgi:Rieske 2Fe-2S family protein
MSATRRRAKPTRAGGAPVTLHAKAYGDPAILERERREVFARAWMIVGHAAEVAHPGDYVAADIAGEPVVALRDGEGRLRAFSNVCRHRAAQLATGRGSCGSVLRCPYHGWTYRLDGTLAAMPEARGFGEDFDRDAVRLPEFQIAELGGLVWVNMDPAAEPIRTWFGEELCERFEALGIDRLVPTTGREWRPRALLHGLVDARSVDDAMALIPEPRWQRPEAEYGHNWKTLADNYLEGYHVPIGHPGLLRLLDYPRYRATLYRRGAWIDGPLRDNPSRDLLERLYQRLQRPIPELPEELAGQWTYIHFWPAQMIDIYPDSMDVWQLQPIDVRRTRGTSIMLRSPHETLRDQAVRRINGILNSEVMDEDVELCDGVQRGLASLTYTRGVLNDNEGAVAQFHDLLRAAVPGIDDLG